jgi:glucose-6-phosphate 1-epimerase
MKLPSSIHRTELSLGYLVFDVVHPAIRARVAQNGAHLMEWTPAGQQPVLYMSPQAVLQGKGNPRWCPGVLAVVRTA